jgi:hypothetical protein
LIWGLIVPLFHTSLPLDIAELVAFSGEGVIANYKHPNLPGLLYELVAWLTGSFGSVYLLSQLSIVASYIAIYLLAKALVGECKAIVAVLLTSAIFYYHWPTTEFNHNILQIPLWAWATHLAWQAVRYNRLSSWIGLGVVAGAMVWTKYSSGILLLWIFIWMLSSSAGRGRFRVIGPYLTAALFILAAIPQAQYLIGSDFLPLEYAARRAETGGISDSLKFVLSQLANHLFFIVLLLIGALLGRGMLVPKSQRVAGQTKFLLLVVVMPVVMVALLPLLSGKGLKSMWGTPMFNFSGLLLLYFGGNRMNDLRERRIKIAALCLIPLIGLLYISQHIWRAEFSDKPMRTLWPQAEMAQLFEQRYQQETGVPLRLIAGSDWLSGTIVGGMAAGMADKPRISIDGDALKSPWITPEVARTSGALIVWQGNPTDSLVAFAVSLNADLAQSQQAEFVWHPDKADKPIVIQYISVPPAKP